MIRSESRFGFSLIEILAAVIIAATIATIAITQFRTPGDIAHARGCELTRETVQSEVMRYIDESGSAPSSDLRQLTGTEYWNGALPTCPSTGQSLQLDRTGKVVCPVHP